LEAPVISFIIMTPIGGIMVVNTLSVTGGMAIAGILYDRFGLFPISAKACEALDSGYC